MRSRWVILTEELGLRTTWILAVFTLVGVVNLTLFILSQGPQWQFLGFGAVGWQIIFLHIPFGWIALGMALLVFSIVAMKRFSWSYLFPFKLFSALLIVGVFSAGGVAFATGVNDILYAELIEKPGEGRSFLAKLYCLCANRTLDSDRALIGEILDVDASGFLVQTPTLELVSVLISDKTNWIGGEKQLETFQVVHLLGQREEQNFAATHIKVKEDKVLLLSRGEEDCADKTVWRHKREVAEKRRRAVLQPISPSVGTAQVVRSIY